MERPIIYHPASGVDRASDGANSVKVDGFYFGWREQVFDRTVGNRTNMQSAVIPDSLDGVANVTFRLVLRQVTVGAGQVVFGISNRQHDPTTDSRDQNIGWSLLTGGLLPPTWVPGTVDREFVIQGTAAASGYTSNLELLSIIARVPTDAGDTFDGEVALVRYDIDFPQLDPITGFWLSGSSPGTIHYSTGNVGIGVNPPLQSLHLSGAVVVWDTAVNTEGAIRYDSTAKVFEGRTNLAWVPLSIAVPDTDWTVSGGNLTALAGSRVDIGLGTQTERLNVGGAIRLNNVAPNGVIDGTISYSTAGGALDFWARKAGTWVSMTSVGGGGNTLGAAYSEPIPGAGRVITVAAGLPVLINGVGNQALRIANNLLAEFGDPAVGIIYYTPGSFHVSTQVNHTEDTYFGTGAVATGVSGDAYVESGTSGGLGTGDVHVRSGNNATSSGTVYLETGGSPSVANRGSVEVSARELRISSSYGIRLNERTSAPGAPTNAGYLYCGDDGGDSEIYWFDDSSNTVKLTEDGWATDGIGTYSTIFAVNRGATAGVTSTSTLRLHEGSVVPASATSLDLKASFGFPGFNYLSLQPNLVGLVVPPVILEVGSSSINSNFGGVSSTIVLYGWDGSSNSNVGLGYKYDGTYDSEDTIALGAPTWMDDDEKYYCGTTKFGWLYGTSSNSLLMQTRDRSGGDSASIGIGTGDADTGGTTSGGIAIITGDGTDNSGSGHIVVSTGSPNGTGVKGNVVIGGNAVNIIGSSFSFTTTGVPGTGSISAGISLTLGTVGAFTAGGVTSMTLSSGLTSSRQPVIIGNIASDLSARPNQLAINRGGLGSRDAAEVTLRSSGGAWYSLWMSGGYLRSEVLGGAPPAFYHTADSAGTAIGFDYTPATPLHWALPPASIPQALDMIAAKIFPIHGSV